MRVRPEACSTCPYRRDVPSGVWAPEQYEVLRPYDARTADQPSEAFGCHSTPEHYCHGWAVVHMNRGPDPEDPLSVHPYDLLALRLSAKWDRVIPEPSTEMFATAAEAADHGQRDAAEPSPEARRAVERLVRKYGERLEWT